MRNKHIAVIDLGSNSFHMIIAQLKYDSSFEIVERRREIVRLGYNKIGNQNLITEEEIQKSIGILKELKQLADRYMADIKAVATSAVRESSNGKIFADKIFKETAIEVEIISGKEEAELIFSGAAEALNLKKKKALVMDIGGGSTEIILGQANKITIAESLHLGTVRLMKFFFPDYIVNPGRINLCRNFIRKEIEKNLYNVSELKYDSAAGASGTILSIGYAIYFHKYGKLPERMNPLQFTPEELKEFSAIVFSAASKEERLLIPGLEEKRADILPAGLLILNELFSFFNIPELYLSEYGLREGLILSYLNSIRKKKIV